MIITLVPKCSKIQCSHSYCTFHFLIITIFSICTIVLHPHYHSGETSSIIISSSSRVSSAGDMETVWLCKVVRVVKDLSRGGTCTTRITRQPIHARSNASCLTLTCTHNLTQISPVLSPSQITFCWTRSNDCIIFTFMVLRLYRITTKVMKIVKDMPLTTPAQVLLSFCA